MTPVAFSPRSASDWARAMPAGFARLASYGRWRAARHHMLWNRLALDLCARRVTRLIVNVPPQHGKSTFWSNYFASYYLGTFPDHDVVVASYEHNFASRWGALVRGNIDAHGANLWRIGVDAASRAADDWRLTGTRDGRPVTGGMRCAGLNSGLTGRPMHLGIIDDPFKDAVQAMSETYRQRAWDWYESVFTTRYQPDTVVVIPMTRWHEDDLVGRILENEKTKPEGWTVCRLPALAEDDDDPLGRSAGEALWPERYNREWMLHVQETKDTYWWGGQYQQRPTAVGGNIFKKRWWSFWKPRGVDLPDFVRVPVEGNESVDRPCVVLPDTFDDATQSWDLTFDSASSRVAGGAWARKGTGFYLLDEEVGVWEFPEQIDAVARMSARHPSIIRKLMEDKANARALLATARFTIAGLQLEPVTGGDKILRAMDVTPLVRAGNVFLPHPAIHAWVWDYIAELAGFATARYDDRVDQTSQALRVLYRLMMVRRRTGTTGTTSQTNLHA